MVDFTIRIKAAVLSRYPRVHKHLIPRPLRGFWMIRARPPKLWTSCEQKVLQVHQPLRFDKKTSTKQRGPPLKTMKCEFHKCLTRLKWKYVRNCLALWIMIEVVAVSRIANSRGVLRGCLWVFYDGIPQEPPTGAQECLRRMSNSVIRNCPTVHLQKVSPKRLLHKRCPRRVSHKSVFKQCFATVPLASTLDLL